MSCKLQKLQKKMKFDLPAISVWSFSIEDTKITQTFCRSYYYYYNPYYFTRKDTLRFYKSVLAKILQHWSYEFTTFNFTYIHFQYHKHTHTHRQKERKEKKILIIKSMEVNGD